MPNNNTTTKSPSWISTRKDLDFLDDDISAQIERRHPTLSSKPHQQLSIMASTNNIPTIPPPPPIIMASNAKASSRSCSATVPPAQRNQASPAESLGTRCSQRLIDKARRNEKHNSSPALSELTETQIDSSPYRCLATPRRLSTVPASSGSITSTSSATSIKSSQELLTNESIGAAAHGGNDDDDDDGILGGELDDGDDESVARNDYKADKFSFPDRLLHWMRPQLFITKKNRKGVERACLIEAMHIVEDDKMKEQYMEVVKSIPEDAFESSMVSLCKRILLIQYEHLTTLSRQCNCHYFHSCASI